MYTKPPYAPPLPLLSPQPSEYILITQLDFSCSSNMHEYMQHGIGGGGRGTIDSGLCGYYTLRTCV